MAINYTVGGRSVSRTNDDFVRSVQHAVGAGEDGVWGPQTTDRLIALMNANGLGGYTDTIRANALRPKVGRAAMSAGALFISQPRSNWNESGLASILIAADSVDVIDNALVIDREAAERTAYVRTGPGDHGPSRLPYTKEDSEQNARYTFSEDYDAVNAAQRKPATETNRSSSSSGLTAGGAANNNPPPRTGLPGWAIGLIAVGAVAAVGGGTYYIVKRQQAKKQLEG